MSVCSLCGSSLPPAAFLTLVPLSPLCFFFFFLKRLALSGLAELSSLLGKATPSQARPGWGRVGRVRVINHDSHLPSCDYQLLNLCERLCDSNSHAAGWSEAGMLFERRLQQDLCPEWRRVWGILPFYLFMCSFPAAFECIQTQQGSTLHSQALVHVLQIHNSQWCENDQRVTDSKM